MIPQTVFPFLEAPSMWFFSSRKLRRSTAKPSSRPTFRPRVRALEDRCLMSAGMLDPTFNPTGNPPGTATAVNSLTFAYSAQVQPSGKIVVVGKVGSVGMTEFDPNGSLDSGFGSGGTVVTKKWTVPYAAQGCVGVLYPTGGNGDEDILVAGPSSSSTFELGRYKPDGSVDTSFGNKGFVTTTFSQGASADVRPRWHRPRAQRILAAEDPDGRQRQPLCRYRTSPVQFQRHAGYNLRLGRHGLRSHFRRLRTQRIGVDPSSSDIIAAGAGSPCELVALHSNGSPDTSFGSNGIVETGINEVSVFQGGASMAVYPATDPNGNAGMILVGGSNGVARYSAAGVLDTSWSTVGSVYAVSLAIQADGKAVAGGLWQVTRLDSGGSLDSSFGTSGVTTVPLRRFSGGREAVLVQPNGDILLAGSTIQSGHNAVGVARLLPSEPEIGSFTASQVMAGGPVTLTASNISDGNPNSTISQVTFYYYDGSGNKIVVGTVTSPDGSGNWTLSAACHPAATRSTPRPPTAMASSAIRWRTRSRCSSRRNNLSGMHATEDIPGFANQECPRRLAPTGSYRQAEHDAAPGDRELT